MKVNLRQYQQEGVDNIRLSYMQGRRSVLYVLPTGGGKTVIFSHISEQAAKKGTTQLATKKPASGGLKGITTKQGVSTGGGSGTGGSYS